MNAVIQANPRKTRSVLHLGPVDLGTVRDDILAIPDLVWQRENAAKPKLKRSMGLWMATALVIGNMVGSGIFLLPASLASVAGPISIFGWVFTGILLGLGVGGATIAPLGDRFGRRALIVLGCLATGLFTLATGGDGGGSIRIPAAFNGLVGMKGTAGRIPRGPRTMISPLTVVVGCLSRSVRDVARLMGMSEAAVKASAHRGYKLLRRTVGITDVEHRPAD